MQFLEINNLIKEINGDSLFKIKKLTISHNSKIGIVGRNGTGKSTLLIHIYNLLKKQSDDVSIGYLPQLYQNDNYSGGEYSKKRLFSIFRNPPQILLLDEPSSNLDTINQKWLLKKIKAYQGTLILVSHSKVLLNEATTSTWHIHNKKIKAYQGNYDTFLVEFNRKNAKKKEEYLEYINEKNRLEKLYSERITHSEKLKQGNLRKLSYSDRKSLGQTSHDKKQKKKAKSATAILKRIDRLEIKEKPITSLPINFAKAKIPEKTNTSMLSIKNMDLRTINGDKLFEVNLDLKIGQVIALVGENGTGKSTLLRTIANTNSDFITVSEHARIGYFSQDLSVLKDESTIIENICTTSEQPIYSIYRFLISVGLKMEQANTQVKYLSGGERAKVQLSKILLSNTNLLLLDEPTNFLDIYGKEAFIEFINSYSGSVIIVSHDIDLLNDIVLEKYFIKNGEMGKHVRHMYTINKKYEDEKRILEFQLSKMLLDDTIPISEIIAIKEQIIALELM